MRTKTSTVLVIDDDESVREAVTCILRSRGLEIIVAKGGQEGVDLALTTNPALILSDIRMPNMNGFEVLDCLQSNVQTANIPFLFMTGAADYFQVVNRLKPGVGILQKPFGLELLVKSVLAQLEGQRIGASGQPLRT
jgi:CheY-like chemotaxis protein